MGKLLKSLLVLSLCIPTCLQVKANSNKQVILNNAQEIDYEAPIPVQSEVLFTQDTQLPSAYDSRSEGYVTAMENQGEFGTCWSYGVISAAETSLLRQGYLSNPKDVDFSELQIAYGFYHRNVDDLYLTSADHNIAGIEGEHGYLQAGGNTFLTAMYLSQWQSIMSEKDFPNVNAYGQLLDATTYENLNKNNEAVEYVLKEAIFLPNEERAIKEALIQYGSVIASYYSQTEYSPYLYNGTKDQTNHVITLVGYDDRIPKEKFADSDTGMIPSRDGAWIMRNSWGEDYGNKGYFYMSYDQYIGTIVAMDFMPKEDRKLYYYDGGVGVSQANFTSESTLQCANVFEVGYADSFTQESLSAVNVGIGSANTSYEIQIYRINENTNDPTNGTKLLAEPLKGQVTYAGLYTIPLKEEIALQPGEAISIVVKLSSTQDLPQIYTSTKANLGTWMNISETIEPNQSYYYDKDGWVDLVGLDYVTRIKAITKVHKTNENNGIQAYTKYINDMQQVHPFLSNALDTEINDVLKESNLEALQNVANKINLEIFNYDLLSEIAQKDKAEYTNWVNGQGLSDATITQINQLNQVIDQMNQALQNKAKYDVLSKAYQEMNDTYHNIMNSIYQKGGSQMLGRLIDTLDIFQYGEDARYLSFSELNEIYTIVDTARRVYESDADEKDCMQQVEILSTTLHKYQTKVKQSKNGSALLKEKLQALKLDIMDNDQAMNFQRRKQKALDVVGRNYVQDVYAAQYVQLSAFVREVTLNKEGDEPSLQLPSQVQNVKLTQINETTIALSWDASKDATSYDIYAKIDNEAFNVIQNVTQTNTTITSLEKGKNYSFYIVAKNKDGEAIPSQSVHISVKAEETESLLPEQVQNLKATIMNENDIVLTWDISKNALGYNVYCKFSSDSEYLYIQTVNTNTTTLPDAPLDTTYWFYIEAQNKEGVAKPSDIVEVFVQEKPIVVVPTKVINVQAVQDSYKDVTLTWDEVEGATSYDVYRKAYKEDAVFTLIKTVEETSLSVTGLMTGKEYSFYVVAKNEAGVSENSDVVAITTKLEGKPTLAIEQVSKTKFTLSWSEIEGATRYIIYRKRGSDPWKKVLTLGGDDLEYTTSELPKGDYSFIVKAGRYDSKNRVMTASSNTVKGTSTYSKPAITLTAGNKQIKVSWKAIEGVTHYEVYRATSEDGKYNKLTSTTSTSFTAKSLTSGKRYYFKVRGYKSYNNGEKTTKIYTSYSTVKYVKAK